MKNSTKHIGKRILDIRKKKGLTQNELCGTEITRNHLSLIEGGKALPSLSALCYIADRLEVPVGFFFSDDENEDAKFTNYFALDELKKAFVEKDFERCIKLAEEIPQDIMGDEVSLIYARAVFIRSIHSAEKLVMTKASALMKKAAEAADRCCYLDRDLQAATEYYSLLFSSIAQSSVPIKLTDLHEASSYVPAEMILYFKTISENSSGITANYLTSSKHKQHADALKAIHEGNTEYAFGLLHELSEFMTLPYYMRYRVYDNLEKCAECLGEFEIAYSAAKRKLELKNL